ncbi:MAG: DUF2235 domain-containing protein [Pirellulales bacterium]|nr:DUF2235 domain-containing protein [Pirellulales bacterium]
MNKRIVICADGTWNRPEEDLKKDTPTNVLRMARAITPVDGGRVPQQVFYDWGIGSYYDAAIGGATGRGIEKNIMDDYRYIVQNYSPGDELFFFGFSRGAYTVRSLSGLINNCGILKRPDARLIQEAFTLYKKPGKAYAPDGDKAIAFRETHSHPSREVKFIGVWDTVGALGIPCPFLGYLKDEDNFYDTKIGRNVRIARHAMAIDEFRLYFEPTVWIPQPSLNIEQVWFAGAHSDVGGGYRPDKDGSLLSDIPLGWMMREARTAGLAIESHLPQSLSPDPLATLHKSRHSFLRDGKKHYRPIKHETKGAVVLIHESVKHRWAQSSQYRPENLKDYISEHGWPDDLVR